MTRRAKLDVQTIGHTMFAPPHGAGTAVFEPIFVPDEQNKLPIPRANGIQLYDGQALAEFAGRACYQAWERKRPETATNKGYLANIQSQSHWSVLEHASITFYIQGVSRALTHELVRHRHMSYSQLSQRYVDSSDVKFVVPPLVEDMIRKMAHSDEGREALEKDGLTVEQGIESFLDTYVADFLTPNADNYDMVEHSLERYLPGLGVKKYREAARAVLPNATETKIVVTGNYRAWAEFLTKRDSLAADAEFQRLAKTIGNCLKVAAPNVFGDEARALWDHAFAEQGASSI